MVTTDDSDVLARLDFIAGLLVAGSDAPESTKLELARKVGLSSAATAAIFGKSEEATKKALQRLKARR